VLAHGSLLHALGMIMFGLLLGLVGTDVSSGVARFSFALPELADGINFVVVAMGVFGLGEIIGNLEHEEGRSVMLKKVTGLMPTKDDLKRIVGPVLRGTGLGAVLGILPAAARCSRPSPPTRWKRRWPGRSYLSAKAQSKAWPRRKPRTTPAHRRRSSRC
jgi:TctA family transporter